jgi:hypothetical protein
VKDVHIYRCIIYMILISLVLKYPQPSLPPKNKYKFSIPFKIARIMAVYILMFRFLDMTADRQDLTYLLLTFDYKFMGY